MKKKPKKTAQTRPKNAGNSAPKPGWENKSALGRTLGLNRVTISSYLDKVGAPPADDLGRYPVEAVRAFISSQGSLRIEGTAVQKMKEEKLAIELEEMRQAAARRSGEIVYRKEIEPTMKAMFAQLTTDLRQEFEEILPAKCKGKTVGEIKVLASQANDRVLLALARGCWSLGAGVPAPAAAAEDGAAPGDQPAALAGATA